MDLEDVIAVILTALIVIGLAFFALCIVFAPIVLALLLQTYYGVHFTGWEWVVIIVFNIIYIFALDLLDIIKAKLRIRW